MSWSETLSPPRSYPAPALLSGGGLTESSSGTFLHVVDSPLLSTSFPLSVPRVCTSCGGIGVPCSSGIRCVYMPRTLFFQCSLVLSGGSFSHLFLLFPPVMKNASNMFSLSKKKLKFTWNPSIMRYPPVNSLLTVPESIWIHKYGFYMDSPPLPLIKHFPIPAPQGNALSNLETSVSAYLETK